MLFLHKKTHNDTIVRKLFGHEKENFYNKKYLKNDQKVLKINFVKLCEQS